MFGTVLFGETYMASPGPIIESVSGTAMLELHADHLVPGWEPIPQGSRIVLSVRFSNLAGEPAEPSTVACQTISPAGQTETLFVSRAGLGVWEASRIVGLPGRWEYRFTGGGRVIAAEESVFWVANSNF